MTRTKLIITMPLPRDVNQAPFVSLSLLESMRQAVFTVATDYLKDCYMKFNCTPIITGEAYQSRSGITAVSTVALNPQEVRNSLEFIGLIVRTVSDEEAWKDKLNKGDKTYPQL